MLTDLIHKLQHGTIAPEELGRFLKRENPFKPKQVFQTFMMVTLGLYATTEDLKKSLVNRGFRVSHWAADILKKIQLSEVQEEFDLVIVSVAELGFKNDTTREQIYARAEELGLKLCPAEVGPALRLTYKDQPMNEWLLIGMEPICDSNDDLDVFKMARGEDGMWLHTAYGGPDGYWSSNRRFVFRK
jgi:hypothetical protein